MPAAVAAVLLAVAGVILLGAAGHAPPSPPQPPPSAAAGSRPVGGPGDGPWDDALRPAARRDGGTGPGAGLPRSRPVTLVVPAIGVRTSLLPLGLNADGTVAVPPLGRDAPAGWYRYLASPGEIGPAVILGHVDSARDGPAVFYRLGALRPGDLISVTRADGRIVVFAVTSVIRVSKQAFPTADVYGPTPDPQLRLITCGGSFDPARHSYRDNVIVFARLTGG